MNTGIELQNEGKMVTYSNVPLFSEEELHNQAVKIIKFMTTIHPFLSNENKWNEGCIELRPVKRDAETNGYLRSYNAWHMGPSSIKALKKFLGLLNGKGYCLYYSIFAFDYSKEIHSNGKVYQKGKINNQNALFTTILVMDFDNITIKDFEKEKQKLLNLDIETIDIFTGHGFQSIILINQKVTDKTILKKFTKLMILKGFKIDPALIDPARVGRQPYSFNCKALDKKSKYYNQYTTEIFATIDVEWTDKRYSIEDIFGKINSLEDVITPTIELPQFAININSRTTSITETEKRNQISEVAESYKIITADLKHLYFMINFEKLPKAVQNMLSNTRDGYRNKVILFLIPFLRNTLGLDIQIIKQIMKLWGEKCTPILEQSYIELEVTRIFGYGLKSKYGKYSEDLVKEYGALNSANHKKATKIIISNTIFQDFDKIKDGTFKIYLSLKLAESVKKTKVFTQTDIEEFSAISRSTFFRNIKDLVKMNYVSKKKGNKINKEECIYYINPYFSSSDGFTMLETSLVKKIIDDLTDGEIKVYIYLCKMIGATENDCWANQKYLSKAIGKTQQGISLITENLMGKKYIKKTTEEKNGIKHCTYNLNC